MIKAIVLAIFAGFFGTMLVWFMMPALKNVQGAVNSQIDNSDPIIQQMQAFGDVWYLSLGFIGFFVIAFILISRGTQSSGF